MKYLFILLTLLVTLSSKAQTTYKNSVVMDVSNYNTWLQCEEGGNGEASFGISTYTTDVTESDDDNYYYDIYLISNSYYDNGIMCSSYIKDIKIYAWYEGEWLFITDFTYVLVKPPDFTYNGYYHLSYIYDDIKIEKIKVTWSEVNIY